VISLLYACLIALLFVALSARVIAYRRQAGISLGDAENPHMRRRIRAQANCAEYAPIGLLLLFMLETQGASAAMLHLLGATLFAGRFLHGSALSSDRQWIFGRQAGMLLTFAMIVIAAVYGLILVVF